MKFIRDEDIKMVFVTMINKLIFGKDFILKPLLEGLRLMSKSDNISKIEALEKEIDDNTSQKELLVKLMAKGYLEPALYNREKNELLMKKEKLTEQRDALIDDLNSELSKGQEVNNLIKYVNKAGSLKEFDDEAFDNHVEEIIVFSRQEIGFVLKSGIILRERM